MVACTRFWDSRLRFPGAILSRGLRSWEQGFRPIILGPSLPALPKGTALNLLITGVRVSMYLLG